MSDKSPHKSMTKKAGKSIKEKRAEKKSKGSAAEHRDVVAESRKR